MKKLLITRWIPESVLEKYRPYFDEIICPKEEEAVFSDEEIRKAIPDCIALYTVGGYRCGKDLIDLGKNLKVIGNFGVGYDNIDDKYATEKGIFVVNTPNAVMQPTAEFTVALIMAIARGVVMYDKPLRESKFCTKVGGMFFDRDMMLYGKTLGVLGFGRIGRAVAQKCQGLGMNVIFYDPFPPTPEVQKQLNAKSMTFDEVVQRADVVTCHMPYTPENHRIINKDVFKKMKKTAYFVNAARGAVMNEVELAQALKEGEIRGAAIDVFEFEPKVTEELASLENVVITPHVASCVKEARINMANETLTGITELLSGKRPHNVVNPELFDR